jgi:DNA-binding GntR family transcriptional regulator
MLMAGKTSGLRRIEREPLCDLAHMQLRQALLAGRFEPGRGLTLRQLAETFGISITPVRDAVNRLVAQGVLHQGPRNSAVVPHLTADALRDLTVVRCELEGRAAFESARNPDDRALTRLAVRLDTMRALIARRELNSYLDIHREFHFDIYDMARIPLLRDMIENLWLRCGPVLSFVVPEYVLSLKGSDHHKAVVQAIGTGNARKAEREIVSDIQEAAKYLGGLADPNGTLVKPRSPNALQVAADA